MVLKDMDYLYFRLEEDMERKRIVKTLLPRFLQLFYKRHAYKRRYPKSFVSANSTVAAETQIGDHCLIRETTIGPRVSIGSFTTTGPQCRFFGKGFIRIGKFCSIAPECLFWSENHTIENVSTYPFELVLKGNNETYIEYNGEDIVIGNDVWIGQRCTILAGAKIGDGCIVCAGAVVTRGEYPPYTVIGGVPAKFIKRRFDEEKSRELCNMRWWDKNPEDIFGPMMDFLHSKGGK